MRIIAVIGSASSFQRWLDFRSNWDCCPSSADYEYRNITSPDQLRGIEIYDYIVLRWSGWEPELERALQIALSRVRQD